MRHDKSNIERGALERVRQSSASLPAGPIRLLVALVGLFRHHEPGYRALEERLIAPNEATGVLVSIALFTDPNTFCSRKEGIERRCHCIEIPTDITKTARHLYGSRLVMVHLAQYDNYSSRIDDAWYAGGLQKLSQRYEATLVLRPDVTLTKVLSLRDACRFGNLAVSAARLPTMQSSGWSSYLACSPLASKLMLSHEADEVETPMMADSLSRELDVWVVLLRCERNSSSVSGVDMIGDG